MPDLTTNLGLKKPVGTETVSRAAYNENLEILDNNVASKIALTTLQQNVSAHKADTATAHGAVAAATASRIIIRDANGRAQVAAPAVAADIARKDTVDAVQTSSNNHKAVTATETQAGHIVLATAAETTAGSDNTRAVHPAGLKVELDKKIPKTLLAVKGDIICASGANTPARLAVGSAGQYLMVNTDGTLKWGDLNVIQPTIPMAVDYTSPYAVRNVWYTVVDVTNGKGQLNFLKAFDSHSGGSATVCRITIDGVITTFSNFHGSAMRGGSYLSQPYFKQSFKVEVSMNADYTVDILTCQVDYALC